MKFYNREKELKVMKTLYKSRPSFVVLTGKRRVGKTELIKEFSKGLRSLYLFVDRNKSRDILLSEYEGYIKEVLDVREYVRFNTLREMMEFLLDYPADLVVVFDEFQRFLKIDPPFITELQNLWDMKGGDSNVFLVASGSSIGMIKKIFIEERAPLFKRADNIISLKPFEIKEIFNILEDMGIKDIKEKLDIYCLFGGTIYYYRLMEKYGVRSFKDALDILILNDFAPLRNEVREVLIEEFGREHSTYYEILSALALGRASKKEIGDATHISASSLTPYFYDLIELLQVAEYRVPVTEIAGKTKKGRYFLKDNFFRFYFKFIYKNMNHYSIGNYGLIKEKIFQQWGDFKGRIFEDIALEFVQKTLPGEYPDIGRFWDRRGNEIDIVGLDKKKKEALLIEVKIKELSSKDARGILNRLKEKSTFLPDRYKNVRCGIMASRIKGKEELKKEGYSVWDFEDMFYSS